MATVIIEPDIIELENLSRMMASVCLPACCNRITEPIAVRILLGISLLSGCKFGAISGGVVTRIAASRAIRGITGRHHANVSRDGSMRPETASCAELALDCDQALETRIFYCVVKIALGIMPWMPLEPSTTWVTR